MSSNNIFGICAECGNSGLVGEVCSQCGGKIIREEEGLGEYDDFNDGGDLRVNSPLDDDFGMTDDLDEEEPGPEDLEDLENFEDDSDPSNFVSLDKLRDDENDQENAPGKSIPEDDDDESIEPE